MPFKFDNSSPSTIPNQGWNDTVNWPTEAADEPEARDLLQKQHDQTRDYINKYVNTGVDTGAANALAVTFDPAPASYIDGYELVVKAVNANTGACTINVNALGAKAIKKNYNEDLVAGDIKAGQEIHLKYDGANFQLLSSTAYNAETVAQRDRGFSLDLPYYYQCNVKQILTFDSGGDAGVTFTYGAYNTSIYKTGDASRGFTNAAGIQTMCISWSNNIDLSVFNNGSASTANDYITLCVYIGGTLPSKICIEFSTSNTGSDIDSKEFFYDISSLSAGWNFIKIPKSGFIKTGLPDWSSLGYLRLFYEGGDATTDVYFDNLQLVRKDPSEAKPNPFQRQINGVWTREANPADGEWTVVQEFGKTVLRELTVTETVVNLIGTTVYGDFESQLTISLKVDNYSGAALCYYINAATKERVYCTIFQNELHLSYFDGAGYTSLNTKSFIAVAGDVITMKLIKKGSTFTVIIIKNGDDYNAVILTGTNNAATGYFGMSSCYALASVLSAGITTTEYASEAGNSQATQNNAVLYKAGAFTANELPVNKYGIDTTNNRLYVKYPNGTIKYVALT